MHTDRDHFTRRHLLASSGMSLGSLALACLLKEEGLLADAMRPELEPQRFDLRPKAPPFPPRAGAMISLFMQGGPSHIDLFDPKPVLSRLSGTNFQGEIKYDNTGEASAKLLGSPWKFRKYGECGMELSELLPHLGGVADEITLIRSMRTGVNNHNQGIRVLNGGGIVAGRPALGSWLTYGLGSESQNLPAFVVLNDPAGLPIEGVNNWSNGGLPSLFQGTVIRHREPRILNLDPPEQLKGDVQDGYRHYVQNLNRRHLTEHPGELDLEARIDSFELAARMQLAAKEALDVSQESEATRQLYGLDNPAAKEFGTRCLLARRLVERGVRFVQIYLPKWDQHNNLINAIPNLCQVVDQPCAGLLRDLKGRGLLDTTLVHWGGEMGRLPVVQNPANPGRDHNTYGFSMWLAGGGIKQGYVHGATDDLGHHAVQDIVSHGDYHATLLERFGLDYRSLVYRHNGQELALVDQRPCRVVSEILA